MMDGAAARSPLSSKLRARESRPGSAPLSRRAGPRCGNRSALGVLPFSTVDRQRLADLVDSGPTAYGFLSGVWTSPLIARVIEEEFGVCYHPRTCLPFTASIRLLGAEAAQRDDSCRYTGCRARAGGCADATLPQTAVEASGASDGWLLRAARRRAGAGPTVGWTTRSTRVGSADDGGTGSRWVPHSESGQ
jgi:hypothetical protein